MARKKFYNEENEKLEDNGPRWKVALYIRLSREDGEKRESDSVTNQRKLLNYYIEQHEEFLSATSYIDENFTGTNFNRPDFQRMVKEIKSGNINCIIVKDLSRFGRAYLEAGNYLENIFPKYNCRFISVIDGIDTFSNPESVNDIMVWIKNMMHEYNSQRISVNVRATKTSQQKAGKYIGTLAPFGYKKDPNNNHKLIVDEEIRSIIENIYQWYISGMGDIRIAKKLNELGISTRAEYRKTGSLYADCKTGNRSTWKPNAVTQILINKVYMGAVAQHKVTTRNYKDRKEIKIEEENQFIIYDMHEPIIYKDKFELVQNRRRNYCLKTSRNKNKVYALSGLLRCKDCGYAMIRNPKYAKGRWYVYYKCRAYNQRGITACHCSHSIREEDLFSSALAAINMHIQTLIDIKHLLKMINSEQKSKHSVNRLNYDKLISEKKKLIQRNKNNKVNCYNDWKDGIIDKDDYIMFKDKYDERLKKLSDEIIALEKEKELQNTIFNNDLKWLNDIVNYSKVNTLTREIAISLIDKIHVAENKELTIDFKFKNEFNTLLQIVSDLGYSEDDRLEVYDVSC